MGRGPGPYHLTSRQRRRLRRRSRRARRSVGQRLLATIAGLGTIAVLLVGGGVLTGIVSLPGAPWSPRADIRPAVALTAAATDAPLVVRVVDASGRPHVAEQVAELARPAGFAVAVAPARRGAPVEQTRILVHRDDPMAMVAAADLQDLLGAGAIDKIGSGPDGLDLTVLVGTDLPAS